MTALTATRRAAKAESPGSSHFSHTLTSDDGLKLKVNVWASTKPVATLLYIHGIQSHSEWLFETGPFLASKGINVVAMDRRGSGGSEGERGHSDNADLILRDYRLAWQYAAQLYEHLPFIVLGQSFGGSILAALACRYPMRADAIIFSAPALGQQRSRHDLYKLNQLRAIKGQERMPLGIRDAEYSSDDKYLRFIANDGDVNRNITSSMASCLVELEDIYFDNRLCLQRIKCPVHLIKPLHDSIIDMRTSREVLARHIDIIEHEIDTFSHYMEFSSKRYDLWKSIRAICANAEVSQ